VATGIYARAFMLGRLSKEQMDGFPVKKLMAAAFHRIHTLG
jgi:hypothetical protein